MLITGRLFACHGCRLQRHNDRRRKRMEDDPAVMTQAAMAQAMAAVSAGLPMLQGALPATKKLKDGNGTPSAMPGGAGAGLDPATLQQMLASPAMLSSLFPGGLPDLTALTASLAGAGGGPGNALHMLANLANASDDPNAAAANANSAAAAMAAAAAAAAAAVSAPGADGAGALPDVGAADGSLQVVGGTEDAAAAAAAAAAGAEAAGAEAGGEVATA
jgi:hypothetical protein